MNLRNRKLLIVIRVLLGLFLIFSGVGGLLAGTSMQGIPEAMVPAMRIFWQTGIMQMIKVTEIVAGLMLVIGFLPQLATIFIAPVCVGIIIFNVRMSPANLPMGLVVTLLTIYLGYAYWDSYRPLFQRRKSA